MVGAQDDGQREHAATDELLAAVRARLDPLIRDGAKVSALGHADAVAADIVARLGLVKNPWADIVGPCYASGGLQKELGVGRAALSKAVRERRALRLDTSDRRTLYPAFQVRGRALVSGLAEVLTTLESGTDDPWAWAHWLNTPLAGATGRMSARPIDRLADGDLAGVVAAARFAAEAWAS
ncbi:hypothetical protein ACO03V_15335 [Microbacterium sp. HMH0099]|uniref:hypothetical protein n=1 Tax=Microbacterium sp. HMH0099 TaxID=3414026 RepID=UPI003BF74123